MNYYPLSPCKYDISTIHHSFFSHMISQPFTTLFTSFSPLSPQTTYQPFTGLSAVVTSSVQLFLDGFPCRRLTDNYFWIVFLVDASRTIISGWFSLSTPHGRLFLGGFPYCWSVYLYIFISSRILQVFASYIFRTKCLILCVKLCAIHKFSKTI